LPTAAGTDGGGAGNSSVPTDPDNSLKQQYDRVVKLMLTVQNVLDDVASQLERWG
jgi:hypothetical protein